MRLIVGTEEMFCFLKDESVYLSPNHLFSPTDRDL
jgi:hypothetical protein